MQTISYQGKLLAYTYSGEGEGLPIVLVHGFLEDSRLWDEWLPLLPNNRPYLRIDLPGFHESELPDTLSIESMAEALHAVVSHLEIDRFVLVGHSMGGYASLAFAEKYGHMLAGLCMFHSHPFADTEEKMSARLKAIDFIERNGHILYVRQAIPQLFIYDFSKGYQMEVNRLIHNAVQFDPTAIVAALNAMRNRPDRSEVLRKIACPVLFLIGQHDSTVSLDQSLAQTSLPTIATVHVFSTVGHMGMFSASRETSKAFKEWLSSMIEG